MYAASPEAMSKSKTELRSKMAIRSHSLPATGRIASVPHLLDQKRNGVRVNSNKHAILGWLMTGPRLATGWRSNAFDCEVVAGEAGSLKDGARLQRAVRK